MFLLILSTLITAASCYNGTIQFQSPNSRLYDMFKILHILICLSGFGMLCNKLSANYKILIPEKIYMVTFTVLVAYLAVHYKFFSFHRVKPNMEFPPRQLLALFIPIRIIKTLFSCSQDDFTRSLPYTFLIGGFGMIFVSAFHGFLMSLAVNNWRFYDYFLYGIIFIPTSPHFIVVLLDQEFKEIATFLKAEFLTAQAITLIIFDILQGFHEGLFNRWYQVVLVIFRYVMGAIFFGYIAGFIIRFVGKISRNNPIFFLCTILGTVLFFYYLAELISVSPILLVIIMCQSFFEGHDDTPDEVMIAAKTLLGTYFYIIDTAIFVYVTYRLGLICFSQCDFNIMYSVLSYLCMMGLRSLAYLLMFPIIKMFCNKYHNLLLLFVVWSLTTDNENAILSLILVYDKNYKDIGTFTVPIVLFKIFISRVINNIICSIAVRYRKRENQMSNILQCLRLINDIQERAIRMWKMDSWKFDVKWQSVKEVCQVRNPMQKSYGLSQKSSLRMCHICSRILDEQQSLSDRLEMRKENRRKILLHMKQIVITQNESGVIASGCVEIISKLIDESVKVGNNFQLDLQVLKRRYERNNMFDLCKKSKKFLDFLLIKIPMPRNKFQRKCYKIYKSKYYPILNHTISLIPLISPIPYLIGRYKDELRIKISTFLFLNLICAFVLSIMSFIAIHAHTFILIRDGIKLYFSSIFHILNFINLMILYVEVACDLYMLITHNYRPHFVLIIKYLRLLYLTKTVELLINQSRKVINTWEEFDRVNVSYVFECYLALKECLDETLLTIHRHIMIDVEIENECYAYLGNMRLEFMNVICEIQAKRPRLANSIKTKQLIRATVANMKGSVEGLKHLGFVDETQYKHLKSSIKTIKVNALKAVKEVDWKAKEILENISWLSDERTIFEYLIGQAGSADFLPDEVILDVGEHSYGVYIILSGVLQFEYSTNNETINNVSMNGMSPVVDHLQSTQFGRDYVDLLTVGCTFGVLSYLTGRSSDCVVKAKSCAKVCFISSNALLKGEEMIEGLGLGGLRCRLWKYATYDMATAILITTSSYYAYDTFKITMKLRRSFIPDISSYKVFDINTHMEDVLLIDGMCIGFYNSITYKAPCYIPSITNRLKIIKEYKPVLLIIPQEGYDEHEVMHRKEVPKVNSAFHINFPRDNAKNRMFPQINRSRFLDEL